MLIDVIANDHQKFDLSVSVSQSDPPPQEHDKTEQEPTKSDVFDTDNISSDIVLPQRRPLEASEDEIQQAEFPLVVAPEEPSRPKIELDGRTHENQEDQVEEKHESSSSSQGENERETIFESSEPPFITLGPLVEDDNLSVDSPDVIVDSSELAEDSTNQKGAENYLEEEFFPEQQVGTQGLYDAEVLLLLSPYPEKKETLLQWIADKPNVFDSISTLIQICQFCSVLSQNKWCLTHINPEFIYLDQPLRFLDLADVYPSGATLQNALEGDYCPPELSYGNLECHDFIMTYLVGALLYQCLYHHKIPRNQGIEALKLSPQPLLHQILTICLSSHPEERFPIAQLRDLLVSTRRKLNQQHWQWNVVSQTTVGLSNNRLQNEDSYGTKQAIVNHEQYSLFAVADGMGGMAHGEVASQLAIETVLHASLSEDLSQSEACENWLRSQFKKANHEINQAIKNGGTTLSVAMAINANLWIGHVGDSRIYHFRNHQLQQLSEDHSMVAMLVCKWRNHKRRSQ